MEFRSNAVVCQTARQSFFGQPTVFPLFRPPLLFRRLQILYLSPPGGG